MNEFSPDDVDFSAISSGRERFAVLCNTEDEAECLINAAHTQFPGTRGGTFDRYTYFNDEGTYYFLNLNGADLDLFCGRAPRLTYSWDSNYVETHGYVVVPFCVLLKPRELEPRELEPSDEDISMLLGGFDG